MHLGVAHTHGDAVAWLPKQRIVFTGDVCVNGPYNYVGDGDVGKWVVTLDAVRKLGAKIVCTGHGPRSVATVLDDQQAFFKALREQVGALMAERPPEEAKSQIESIRATLKGNAQIARYVGDRGAVDDSFPSQVGKVYEELTGKKLAALTNERQLARPCPRPLPRSLIRKGVGRAPLRREAQRRPAAAIQNSRFRIRDSGFAGFSRATGTRSQPVFPAPCQT